jgi:hypothetical protein
MPTVLYLKDRELMEKQVGSTSKIILEERVGIVRRQISD